MLVARIAGATRFLGAPANWDEATDGFCGTLPVLDQVTDGLPVMVSAWEPTPEELVALNAGAPVYLRIVGHAHPPVAIWVEPPK